jgi:hypothetical protein
MPSLAVSIPPHRHRCRRGWISRSVQVFCQIDDGARLTTGSLRIRAKFRRHALNDENIQHELTITAEPLRVLSARGGTARRESMRDRRHASPYANCVAIAWPVRIGLENHLSKAHFLIHVDKAGVQRHCGAAFREARTRPTSKLLFSSYNPRRRGTLCRDIKELPQIGSTCSQTCAGSRGTSPRRCRFSRIARPWRTGLLVDLRVRGGIIVLSRPPHARDLRRSSSGFDLRVWSALAIVLTSLIAHHRWLLFGAGP